MNRYTIVQNSLKTTLGFRQSYIEMLLPYGQVSVIAPADDQCALAKLQEMGVIVHNVPPMGNTIISRLRSIFYMNYFILKERMNKSVIICHFLITFVMSFICLVPFNNRCVIYVEGLGSVFSKYSWLKKIIRWLLLNSNVVRLFCNEDERNELGMSTDEITGGIGVDVHKFQNSSSKLKMGGGFKLLYIGRLIKDKGVMDAIEVLRLLMLRKHHVELILVGDIYPSNPSSLTLSDINNLKTEFNESIVFAGYSNNVLDFYHQANLLLLPSVREGFPVCVMEASAVGIPTVGYYVAGVSDAIKNGVNGYLVNFKDLDALADVVEHSMNEQVLNQFRVTARKYAEENFDQAQKSNRIVNILTAFNSSM